MGGFQTLNDSDRQDGVSRALSGVLGAIRAGRVVAQTNAEIIGYMNTAIVNSGRNLIRDRKSASDAMIDSVPDAGPSPAARAVTIRLLDQAAGVVNSWPAADQYIFLAKLAGVSTATIKATLEGAPYGLFRSEGAIDTRFHRLRQILREQLL